MFNILLGLLNLFTNLPKKSQEKIIDALVDALRYAFRHLFKAKKKEDLKEATAVAVTPQRWEGTTATVSTFAPPLFTQKKKEEFAHSVVELVKSEGFINNLSKRIEHLDTDDEEVYVALCSIETKRLIMEMMNNK